MLDRSFDANSLHHELFGFDAEVPIGWRRSQRLQIGPDRIVWGHDLVPLVAVTGVAWTTRAHTVNLTQRGVERTVRLLHPGGALDIRIGGSAFGPANDADQLSAFSAIVQVVTDVVEPRVRNDMLSTIRAADAPVTVGGLPMSSRGIHHEALLDGRQVTLWTDVPVAEVEGNQVTVRIQHEGLGEVLAQRPTSCVNAVMLPALLSDIALGAL